MVDAMLPERVKAIQASMTTMDCEAFTRCQQPILETMIPIEAAARRQTAQPRARPSRSTKVRATASDEYGF